jgi:dethiobiotin synthetase
VRRVKRVFVTGTDTGVGKTVITAAIVAALRAGGRDAIGLKPVVTGTDEPPEPGWLPDHELLAAVSEAPIHEVNFAAYGPPVSPHLAAELSGRHIDPAELAAAIRASAERHELAIVEGVGGLLVPLTGHYDVGDLAAELKLPVIVVARAGLGTINHTLLTLKAGRAQGLRIAAVVLNNFPRDRPTTIERSNLETLERLGGDVETTTFPELASAAPETLAAAGETLPFTRWFDK